MPTLRKFPNDTPEERKERKRLKNLEYYRQRRADPKFKEIERTRALKRHHERKYEQSYAQARREHKKKYDASPEGALKNKQNYDSRYADPVFRQLKLTQAKVRNAGEDIREARLRRKLHDRYGLTLEGRNALLAAQGGMCGCCQKPIAFGGFTAHVDHCHDTGRVRGILCNNCNTGIGSLGDSLDGLERAMRYLKESEK